MLNYSEIQNCDYMYRYRSLLMFLYAPSATGQAIFAALRENNEHFREDWELPATVSDTESPHVVLQECVSLLDKEWQTAVKAMEPAQTPEERLNIARELLAKIRQTPLVTTEPRNNRSKPMVVSRKHYSLD